VPGAGAVAAEGGLGVGSGGCQAQGSAAQAGPVVQEPGDRCPALVFVWFWWHGEPRVTGKQVEHGVDVAGLDGGREAAGELAFAGGARRRRVLAAGGQACLERGPGALQAPLTEASLLPSGVRQSPFATFIDYRVQRPA